MTDAVGWPQVLAWRMRRQHLAERRPAGDLLAVVGRLGGLHAQLDASAELTARVRIDGLAAGALAGELWKRRRLVRTWAMRGTLHVLPADELGLWAAAQRTLKPRWHAPAWQRYHGITRAQVDAVLAALPEVLADRSLTREELARETAAHVGDPGVEAPLREGFGAVLKLAAMAGELCFAEPEGRRVRFARPADQLAAVPRDFAPDEAAAEVARRYLGAYGPGTREQLARWFGSPSAAQAGRWIAALGDEVVQVAVDGAPMWALRAQLGELLDSAPAGVVRLLPAFDQYVVAAPRDGGAVVPEDRRAAVYRPQGWLSPVVVVDGRVVATWRAGDDGFAVEPFAPLDRRVRSAIDDERERLGLPSG